MPTVSVKRIFSTTALTLVTGTVLLWACTALWLLHLDHSLSSDSAVHPKSLWAMGLPVEAQKGVRRIELRYLPWPRVQVTLTPTACADQKGMNSFWASAQLTLWRVAFVDQASRPCLTSTAPLPRVR